MRIHRSGIPYDRILALATGRLPTQPRGTWTSYDAFQALTTNPALGLGRARALARTAVGPPVGTDPGGCALLDPTGEGDIVITRAGEPVATVPVADGVPAISAAPREWLSGFDGTAGVTLEEAGVNLWDVESAQISIINLATVRALSEAAGLEIDPDRFRANVYVDDLDPWGELALIGHRLRVGTAELEVFAAIERCRATSARPAAVWDINVPALLVAHFGHPYCGLYARVIRPGEVRVDDTVAVGSGAPEPAADPDPEQLLTTNSPRYAEVVHVSAPTERATSLVVKDPLGLLQEGAPGQYLRVHGADAVASWRNYTISDRDALGVRITVQPDPEGRFSPWLRGVRPGQRLLVSGPYGSAVLDDGTGPIVVMTAGIGVTPALRLVRHLASTSSPRFVDLLHVARNLRDVPHLDELFEAVSVLLDCSLTLFLTDPTGPIGADRSLHGTARVRVHQGRPSLGQLSARLTQDRLLAGELELFACGPTPFTDHVRRIAELCGVPKSRIRIDPFYSPTGRSLDRRPPPAAGPFTVHWGDGLTSDWNLDSGTLLDLAEAAGLRLPSGCRSGVCGTCAAKVAGETAYLFDPADPPRSGQVLLCAAVPSSELVVDSGLDAGNI
jgi:ferredoxin-NADP reductase/ferredoxin